MCEDAASLVVPPRYFDAAEGFHLGVGSVFEVLVNRVVEVSFSVRGRSQARFKHVCKDHEIGV